MEAELARGTLIITAIGLAVTTAIINFQIVKQRWHWILRELAGFVWTFAALLGVAFLASEVWAQFVPWSQPFIALWGIASFLMAAITVFVPNEIRRQVGI